ncbi:MAG: MoaD/ThiS family protein [Thermofilum sp.]
MNSGGRIRVVVDIFGREVRELSLAEGATVVDLLNLIGFKASEVVVAVDGEVVAEDEPLRDGSRVKLHSVVSGG